MLGKIQDWMNASINIPLNNKIYDICEVCCLKHCSNTTNQSRTLNISLGYMCFQFSQGKKKFPHTYHIGIDFACN